MSLSISEMRGIQVEGVERLLAAIRWRPTPVLRASGQYFLARSPSPGDLALMWHDGQDLRSGPLLQRKQTLERIVRAHPSVLFAQQVETLGCQLFNIVRERDLEGIEAKRKDAHTARTGSRSAIHLIRGMRVGRSCSRSVQAVSHKVKLATGGYRLRGGVITNTTLPATKRIVIARTAMYGIVRSVSCVPGV
jgi:hypothetical protein